MPQARNPVIRSQYPVNSDQYFLGVDHETRNSSFGGGRSGVLRHGERGAADGENEGRGRRQWPPSADTARDENRKPAEMLAFGGIGPGKVVVDMLPGGGYFTRIFAKAVEPVAGSMPISALSMTRA